MNRFFLTLAAMLWAHVWCAAAPAPDGVRGTVRLVATYVGFVVDTLAVAPMEAEAHFALRPVAMAEVTVGARRAGSSLDRLSALTTINVTSAELTRAACCNLGESFETNASVDVGYQDAITGARAIRMLGLGGQYVQMMTENVPNLRGLASTFGLSYVPGPWMDGISVSKGVGTVVNGYEAITGQIDVEYKKPIGEGTASGNVFDSSARTLVFVADGSRSFSNTVQLEARWQPLRGLDLDVAWRLNDARQTTAGRLRSTPLQSRYKALLAASAARPHRHHHLPHRQDHRRGALPGRQQAGLRVDHSQPHRHARQGRRLSRRARQATPLAATRRTAPSPCPALPPPPLTDCSTAATAAAKGTRRLHFPLKSVD